MKELVEIGEVQGNHYFGPETDDSLLESGPSWVFAQAGVFVWIFLIIIFVRGIDIVSFLLSALILASLFHILPSVVARVRRSHPLESHQVHEILRRAKSKLDYEGTIEIWLKDSRSHLIVSASTFLYKSILISPMTVEKLVRDPVNGEVVLAWEVSKIKNTNTLLRFLAGIVFFIGASIGELGFIYFSITPFFELILAFLLNQIVFILLVWSVGFILILRKYTLGNSEREVEQSYGIHPLKASVELFAERNTSSEAKDRFLRKHEFEDDNSIQGLALFNGFVISVCVSIVVVLILTLFEIESIFVQPAAIFLGGATFALTMYSATSQKEPQMEKTDSFTKQKLDGKIVEEVIRILEKEYNQTFTFFIDSLFEDYIMITVEDSNGKGIKYLDVEMLENLESPEIIAAFIIGEISRGESTKKIDRFGMYSFIGGLASIIPAFALENILLFPVPVTVIIETFFIWLLCLMVLLVVLFKMRSSRQMKSDLRFSRLNSNFTEALRRLSMIQGNAYYNQLAQRLRLIEQKKYTMPDEEI